MDGFREKIMKLNTENKVLSTLKNIFLLIHNEKGNYVPENSIKQYYIILYKSFTKDSLYEMQDSALFLGNLLFNIEKDTQLGEKYQINVGEEIFCLDNKNNKINIHKNNPDKYSILFLDINGKSLKDILQNYSKEIYYDSLHHCNKKKGGSITYIDIPDSNQYIFISLKRYKESGHNRFNKSNIIINKDIIINGIKYILVGAVLKSGSEKGGHYIYTTYTNGKFYYRYDDSLVTKESHYSMTLEKNSYVLLYKRVITINNQLHNMNNTINEINNEITRNIKIKKNILQKEHSLIKEKQKK